MRRLLPVLLLALTIVLAGCVQETPAAEPEGETAPPPQSEEVAPPPDQVLRAAVLRFGGDLAADGAAKRLQGSFSGDLMPVTFDNEYGSNGVVRLAVTLGGFFSMTTYCKDGAGVVSMMDEVFEGRHSRFCEDGGLDDKKRVRSLTVNEGESFDVLELTPAADGGLVALLSRTNATGQEAHVTYKVDAQGRVYNVTVEDDDGTMWATVEYGHRRAIQVPAATARLPAEVSSTSVFRAGEYRWSVDAAEDVAPLTDFEVRVFAPATEEAEDAEGEVLATFHPATAGAQSAAGFTFEFVDDGDGSLGTGDAFVLRNAAWEDEHAYEIVVFDTWAGLGLDENPMPWPGVMALLAALGAAAALVRRR